MLSICIPVYNYDIVYLVQTLTKQAKELHIPYEILTIDDASSFEFKEINSSVRSIENVNYLESENNNGRAKIRNLLAQNARFDYLLFMDCDAQVPESFLKNYIENIHTAPVIVGGVAYSNNRPKKNLLFRWRYGKKRESTNASERSKKPYDSFKTFNFLIQKSIFEKICFNEKIKHYGHEDTLFGIELKKMNVSITHIENPLIHVGLESNRVFLEKTRKGIENLFHLSMSQEIPEDFTTSVSILRFFLKLPSFLKKVIAFKFWVTEPFLKWWLETGIAPIYIFDFYKLGFLCSLNNKNNS